MSNEFRIEFEPKAHGLLRVRVSGVRSLDSTIGYWEAILERIAGDSGTSGLLLVDQLVGEELAASEWKQLVAHVLGRGLEGVRIAHVKPFAIDQVDYCERYANEAGLEAGAFRREPDAVEWLEQLLPGSR